MEKAIVLASSIKLKKLKIFGKPQQLLDAIMETGNQQFFFLDIEIKGQEKRENNVIK
ncbi:hypothetical protein ACVRXS_09450 [Streptococcus orisratti]|uniref:hypothetical protein n=1 Tax=Streptococcus TaxID=1301 RepID=UPI0003698989